MYFRLLVATFGLPVTTTSESIQLCPISLLYLVGNFAISRSNYDVPFASCCHFAYDFLPIRENRMKNFQSVSETQRVHHLHSTAVYVTKNVPPLEGKTS